MIGTFVQIHTHLHGEDSDVVPTNLLSVQRTHRHQYPRCDFNVEVFVRVCGPLDGVPVGKWNIDISNDLKSALLCGCHLVILSEGKARRIHSIEHV